MAVITKYTIQEDYSYISSLVLYIGLNDCYTKSNQINNIFVCGCDRDTITTMVSILYIPILNLL